MQSNNVRSKTQQRTLMVNIAATFILLLSVYTIGCDAAPRPDEERYFDREVNWSLIKHLSTISYQML